MLINIVKYMNENFQDKTFKSRKFLLINHN